MSLRDPKSYEEAGQDHETAYALFNEFRGMVERAASSTFPQGLPDEMAQVCENWLLVQIGALFNSMIVLRVLSGDVRPALYDGINQAMRDPQIAEDLLGDAATLLDDFTSEWTGGRVRLMVVRKDGEDA